MSKKWLESTPTYFNGYLSLVTEDSLLDALHNSFVEFEEWASEILLDKGTYAYAEDKWSVNEVLQHVIDAERIFQYRAVCIARGEMNELPGFDHEMYAKNSKANTRNLVDIVDEMKRLRLSSIDLFQSIDNTRLKYKGMANGYVVQPLLYGFLLSGHLRHHLAVLKSQYA